METLTGSGTGCRTCTEETRESKDLTYSNLRNNAFFQNSFSELVLVYRLKYLHWPSSSTEILLSKVLLAVMLFGWNTLKWSQDTVRSLYIFTVEICSSPLYMSFGMLYCSSASPPIVVWCSVTEVTALLKQVRKSPLKLRSNVKMRSKKCSDVILCAIGWAY